jgi:hypothetical protein
MLTNHEGHEEHEERTQATAFVNSVSFVVK